MASSSQTVRSPPLVGLGLVGHAAERERGGDCLEGGGRDGDEDHWRGDWSRAGF
jgi:hypothetical protein